MRRSSLSPRARLLSTAPVLLLALLSLTFVAMRPAPAAAGGQSSSGEDPCRGKPKCRPGTIPGCPPGEPGVPADGNCPVDPKGNADRLLCCSKDKAGNEYQVWCVSNQGGRVGQYVDVYIPNGGAARAIGACWFDGGSNEREYTFDDKNNFCKIKRNNIDQFDKDPNYDNWIYEYDPKTDKLKKTGVKDEGGRDPDGREITPPTDYTQGLRCTDPGASGIDCPIFFDSTSTDPMTDGVPEQVIEGDLCETAVPVSCPAIVDIPIGAFADDYCLGDCAAGATDGPDAYLEVSVTTGQLQVTATPDPGIDVAIIVSVATCDSCVGGVNFVGTGGSESLLLSSLPSGTYKICVKAVGGSSGDVSVQVSCAATAVDPTSWGRIKGLYR